MIRIPLILARSVISSSVIPSLKYSCSGSVEVFRNGNTRKRRQAVAGAQRPGSMAKLPRCKESRDKDEAGQTIEEYCPQFHPSVWMHFRLGYLSDGVPINFFVVVDLRGETVTLLGQRLQKLWVLGVIFQGDTDPPDCIVQPLLEVDECFGSPTSRIRS